MANKFKPATKADSLKVIKALFEEGITSITDIFGYKFEPKDVVYWDQDDYPECSLGCILVEVSGKQVSDIIKVVTKLGYRYAKDFGDGIVLVFAPKGVTDKDIESVESGAINESTDVTIQPEFQSKILAYAAKRIKESGAVVLADIKDIITFNDPLDGMISFSYLDTLAEGDELSEDGGYQYIEDAVSDIADYIQQQGYTLDPDSDDPFIFVDDRYDDADVGIEESSMNESVKWNETDEPNQWVNKLTKNKVAIDPITLECKDLGVAVLASKLSEDNNFYKVMVVATDTGKSMTKTMPFDGIDLEAAISKLKKCDNKDDLYNTISKYLFLRQSDVSKLFSTSMINESAQIRPCDPELEGFDLLDSNNPFDFEPVDLENEELGFYAIAGVATGMGGDFDEDDCSIEICVTALDPEAADEVLVAEYYDVDYKAMEVMRELAKATTFPELANILHKEGFQGMNGDYSDFVEDLTKLNEMNEYTEVPDGRMTVELDDSDVIEGDTHLLAELTDEVFQAINTVMDELDPDADLSVIEDTEDKLVIEVVSDEDLDDDAFDEVLSELLEDIDLENIVADMTDSVPITDPADEDFGRVVQYINFYEINGDTVTPSGATMEDNLDYIEDEDVMNEAVIELESGRKVHYYVDDLNFKAGVKFLEGESAINKVLKAINSKASVDDYGLDKLPWVTYKTEEGDKVAVFYESPVMPYKMSLAIGDGKNLSDFVSNSKSILVFNNLKKLDDWNNINIIVRIMNNLAKVTDRASEYKAIKSLLSNYEKQVYNYAKYDESFDPLFESYYKDTDEDLSIDQTKINKALKAIDRILTKAGYHLDNLDKVYRFNYPRPGLIEVSLIPSLNATYGYMGNKAYDIDRKIEKKLESLNLTYASSSNSVKGKEIYTDDDKLVHYMSNELDKYIKTGKVPDREYSRNMVSAVHPKLEDIAKDITKYIESHPKYKKFNLYEYPPVHAGADWIKVKVETEDIQDGKDILIDTDKYIAKNHKELYHRVASKSSVKDKKYPFIEYSTAYTPKPGEGTLMWSNYEMRGSSIKDLMNESTNHPKLPTQKELQAIIQKSMIKSGEGQTRVTVHAYRSGKYENGVVEVDLDNTSLATDGREDDYYNEDDIRNSLEYAVKELVDKFGQDKDLLDYIDVQYNRVGSLTITFSLDSEFNESYSMNEATKVTFRYDDEKDWVSPEDFKKIEKFATKMEDAFERYLRYMRDLGPNDKLKDQFYTEINVENREKIVIVTKTKKKVLKRDITAKLDKYGYNPDPSSYIKALPLEEVKATERGVGWGISPVDKSLGVYVYTGFKALAEPDYFTRIMRGEIKPGDPDPNAKATNESTKFDFDNLEEVIEEDLDSAIDLPDYADGILVYCYPTGQGYGVKVTLDERLVGDNKLHIIDRITKVVIDRCGKDYDLDQKRNRSKGEYYLTYSYKGSPFNECTLYPATPDNTDYNQSRKDSLAKAMVTDQPLVDEYDIRCTIRPVFIRKGQYLYDGSTVYRTTSDAKLNDESGLYDIKVDVLLSNDEALAEPSTTISYSADFTGLKLLKSNPVKPYNESTSDEVIKGSVEDIEDNVSLGFATKEYAEEFVKANDLNPKKYIKGKFGWTVIFPKSDYKKIRQAWRKSL